MASLPLFHEISSSPKLVGIARIAADAESLREGHNVEYFTLGTRSLLSRVVSGRNLPFTWAINPYRGCEFACKYCYARYTHEFMELRDGVDFERKIFVKQEAAALLRSELRKVKRGEEIAIGTATDPNALFLKPCSAAIFLPFLEHHFPALVGHYRTRYADRSFLPKGYAERLSQLMAALRKKYGFGDRHAMRSRAAHPEIGQMELF